MEFQTLIENRRSVRKYSSNTNVTKEQIQQLVQAAFGSTIMEKIRENRSLLLCFIRGHESEAS